MKNKIQDKLNRLAKKEHREAMKEALAKNLKKDGIDVMETLKSKGWTNVAYLQYAEKHQAHSDYYVICGYSGCYNSSKLIKLLF